MDLLSLLITDPLPAVLVGPRQRLLHRPAGLTLECVSVAYDRMMSGKALYRVLLTIGDRRPAGRSDSPRSRARWSVTSRRYLIFDGALTVTLAAAAMVQIGPVTLNVTIAARHVGLDD